MARHKAVRDYTGRPDGAVRTSQGNLTSETPARSAGSFKEQSASAAETAEDRALSGTVNFGGSTYVHIERIRT
jgi:hypothetical protein